MIWWAPLPNMPSQCFRMTGERGRETKSRTLVTMAKNFSISPQSLSRSAFADWTVPIQSNLKDGSVQKSTKVDSYGHQSNWLRFEWYQSISKTGRTQHKHCKGSLLLCIWGDCTQNGESKTAEPASIRSRKPSVSIESLRLDELSISGFVSYPIKLPKPLHVVYPETLKSLTTNRTLEEINFLVNLECLRTWNSFLLTEHKTRLLRAIPKLRTIYYEVHEKMGRAYRSWTFRMLQKLLYDFRAIRPGFRIGLRLMTDRRREIEIYPRNHDTIQGNVPFLSDRRRSRRWQWV